MTKYAPLSRALSQRTQDSWPMTFAEIESLLGSRLPSSARRYPAWWSNNPTNNTMTRVWLDAGWKTENVDVPGERVTFRRAEQPYPAGPAGFNDGKGQPPLAPADSVLDRLSPAACETLALIARRNEITEAEAALRLLERALDDALPRLRADRAKAALAARSGMATVDTEALVRQSRDLNG